MGKNWSTLEKGDTLYLLVPYEDYGIIKYEFQESQVINMHTYDWCTNIRFKYTDKNINRRRRIELCVNENKYNDNYVSYDKENKWRTLYETKWGDLIICYDSLNTINEVYKLLIQNKIKEQEALIESHKIYLEKLNQWKNITIANTYA